jgi:hypothetical protein
MDQFGEWWGMLGPLGTFLVVAFIVVAVVGAFQLVDFRGDPNDTDDPGFWGED